MQVISHTLRKVWNGPLPGLWQWPEISSTSNVLYTRMTKQFAEPTFQFLGEVSKGVEYTKRSKSKNYSSSDPNALMDWTIARPVVVRETFDYWAEQAAKTRKDKRNSSSQEQDQTQDIPMARYSPDKGITELQDEVIAYFKRQGFEKVEPNNITLSTSVFEIIKECYQLFYQNPTLFGRNEPSVSAPRVLIPSPTFGYYIQQCCEWKMKPTIIDGIGEREGWKLTPERLQKAIDETYISTGTKPAFFLFTNPVNPTGVVYNEEEVRALAKVLWDNKIFTISDEVFKEVCFEQDENKKPYSIGAVKFWRDEKNKKGLLADMEDWVLTLNGVGKSRGLVGARVSFAVGPDKIINKLSSRLSGMATQEQEIAAESLRNTSKNQELLANNITKHLENINKLNKELIPNLNQKLNAAFQTGNIKYVEAVIENPQATSLFLLRFKGLKGRIVPPAINYPELKSLETGLDIAKFLYHSAKLAMVPGEGFYIDPKEMILRASSAYSPKELEKGFERIGVALSQLTPQREPNFRNPNAVKLINPSLGPRVQSKI